MSPVHSIGRSSRHHPYARMPHLRLSNHRRIPRYVQLAGMPGKQHPKQLPRRQGKPRPHIAARNRTTASSFCLAVNSRIIGDHKMRVSNRTALAHRVPPIPIRPFHGFPFRAAFGIPSSESSSAGEAQESTVPIDLLLRAATSMPEPKVTFSAVSPTHIVHRYKARLFRL